MQSVFIKNRFILHSCAAGLMAIILTIDLLTSLGLSVTPLYILAVVISFLADDGPTTLYYAGICTLLLLFGFAKNPAQAAELWVGMTNRFLTLGLIWVTAILGIRLKVAIREIAAQKEELSKANRDLERMARHDGLTGVANRRAFDEVLASECSRAYRQQTALSLLMIDIDSFKAYNDLKGHQPGDVCLLQVAQAILLNARRLGDLVARYGGEEFAVIFPGANKQGAFERAEAIRKSIENLAIEHPQSSHDHRVTVSIGISTILPADVLLSPSELIHRADEALYRAKQKGRNRVEQS
jgi:diguanylate cyclase (GGDEF)-like protein